MDVSVLHRRGAAPPSAPALRVQSPLVRHARRHTATCHALKEGQEPSRRGFVLNGVNVGVLGALFAFGGEEPSDLGVQDVGNGQRGLGLCPRTPTCVSTTSGEFAQDDHYVPPWTYNPMDGRGRKSPVSRDKAFEELVDVIQSSRPDNFTPTVVKQTDDYIHVEYESPFFGFKDDVEFWFPKNDKSTVEYRSASRLGDNDNKINRKRIKELRKALESKGWSSVGFA